MKQNHMIDTTYLRKGDQKRIAKELGVTQHMVSRVAQGIDRSAAIERVIAVVNEERRKIEEAAIEKICADIRKEAVTDINEKA